ncbi:hypothetical protein RJ641_035842 [Dillenia turbinata]|uniref:Uncharacterized protein n=1 Tax=Dillenia turbinata TaxID=194707 RepID=A0AAN8VDC2_9MAGN
MAKSIPTSTTLRNLATKIAASKKLKGSFKTTQVIPTKSLRSDQIKRSNRGRREFFRQTPPATGPQKFEILPSC